MKRNCLYLFLLLTLTLGCREEFLGLKSDKKMIVPQSLEDMQALLDYYDVMNRFLPWIEEVQADDYYISTESWNTLASNPLQRNAYLWASDVYGGETRSREWNVPYSIIFQANVVLDGLNELDRDVGFQNYNDVKARALFFRAWQFFRQAVVFAPAYERGVDNRLNLGIPLRISSDLHEVSVRSNLEETFERIVSDLLEAERLISGRVVVKSRPSQTAVQALLARVFLYMQQYEQAEKYASLAISSAENELLDFATLDENVPYPMSRFNQEVLFQSVVSTPAAMAASRLNVDSTLYELYGEDDFRKRLWFRMNSGRVGFKGSYDGSSIFFNGITLGECYLTKAECLVRLDRLEEGMTTLSQLLEKRIVDYQQPTLVNKEEALNLILIERRKEMIFKGNRWMDLKRLNLNPQTAQTIVRKLDDQFYSLHPRDKNYVFPIPQEVIELTGLEQNERQ